MSNKFNMRKLDICVPSYCRSEVFTKNTLPLIMDLSKKNKLRPIKLFVENDEQATEYKEKLKPILEGGNLMMEYHITNTKGIGEKRNFMKKAMYNIAKISPSPLYVLYIDDDIKKFNKKNDTKITPVDLDEIIKKGFKETEDRNLFYWGINNLTNGMFLKHEVSTTLKYIQGGFCGEIITDNLECPQTEIDHYEDYCFNLQYYIRDKGVVRLNDYCLTTKPWRDGGINKSLGGLEARKATMSDNSKYLIEKYGTDLLTIKERKWGKEPYLNWRHIFTKKEQTLLAIPSMGRHDNILTLSKYLSKYPLKYLLKKDSKSDSEYNRLNADIKLIVPMNQVELYENSNQYENVEVVGCNAEGIGATRAWILERYNKTYDFVVMLDDDIEGLKRVRGNIENKTVEKCLLNDLIHEMKDTLKKREAYFGGITLCPNEFYAKDQISNKLKYISGALQIYRSSNRPLPRTNYRHFEDYVYNIEYFKRDGIICRWDGVIPTTKNYNPNGGICSDYGSLEARLADAEKVADLLVNKYGSKIVRKVFKKKTSRNPECVNLMLNHKYKCNSISLNFN